MVLLVPFDGSALSEAALERATEFANYRGEDVTVLSVIPDDAAYARERGWVDADATFAVETVADRMREQAASVAPTASFRYEIPDDVSSMASTTTDITRTIREVAHDEGASIVFIGSENAGRVSSPVCSVGSPVSEDPQYDVHIVRHA
ncbi:universal stress protein [Haloarcula sp. CBA1130]|uniref:universal stress protein n=1 Tax=unclassified Haloarcula TaxID=2624677 RepID=UPI0012445284|nr:MULTISPECIES: universal stress protein [unclassified Haloarcula]KAA9398871.1 universal stress protein [Haloarcula sp. CBA1129]KAA9403385.1 universal stress protein [Haloarcula sp. CBA1130]